MKLDRQYELNLSTEQALLLPCLIQVIFQPTLNMTQRNDSVRVRSRDAFNCMRVSRDADSKA